MKIKLFNWRAPAIPERLGSRGSVTGLRISGKTLEWTTLRESNSGLEKIAGNRVTLDIEDAALTDAEKFAAGIREQCPALTGPVALGIASDQMLLRVVELPTSDPAEMNSMIQLQMDKFSPFPDDRMAVTYEALRITEGTCLALIAAVQKDLVDFYGLVFQKAGLELCRIDIEAMGWLRLLSESNAMVHAGRQIIVLTEGGRGVLFIMHNGLLAAVRTIGPGGDLPPEEQAAEVARDVGALVLSLDLEQGVAPLTSLNLWHKDIDPALWSSRLQAELGHAAQVGALEQLPPLSEGLVRRMFNPPFSVRNGAPPGVAVIDLVPAVWRSVSESRRMKRRLLIATSSILSVWLLAILIFMTGFQLQKHRLKKLEDEMDGLKQQIEEIQALQKRVKSFEQTLDRRRTSLECLREFSRLLPPEVDLTSFQFKKGKNVIVRGETLSVNLIYDFKQALDNSELFKGIEMGSIQPSKRKEVTVQTFQMTAKMPEGAK